jgi:hypothetical protein
MARPPPDRHSDETSRSTQRPEGKDTKHRETPEEGTSMDRRRIASSHHEKRTKGGHRVEGRGSRRQRTKRHHTQIHEFCGCKGRSHGTPERPAHGRMLRPQLQEMVRHTTDDMPEGRIEHGMRMQTLRRRHMAGALRRNAHDRGRLKNGP